MIVREELRPLMAFAWPVVRADGVLMKRRERGRCRQCYTPAEDRNDVTTMPGFSCSTDTIVTPPNEVSATMSRRVRQEPALHRKRTSNGGVPTRLFRCDYVAILPSTTHDLR